MVHGCDGTAVAQVAGDQAQVAHRAPEQVGGLLGGVAVARAVRTVQLYLQISLTSIYTSEPSPGMLRSSMRWASPGPVGR